MMGVDGAVRVEMSRGGSPVCIITCHGQIGLVVDAYMYGENVGSVNIRILALYRLIQVKQPFWLLRYYNSAVRYWEQRKQ